MIRLFCQPIDLLFSLLTLLPRPRRFNSPLPLLPVPLLSLPLYPLSLVFLCLLLYLMFQLFSSFLSNYVSFPALHLPALPPCFFFLGRSFYTMFYNRPLVFLITLLISSYHSHLNLLQTLIHSLSLL